MGFRTSLLPPLLQNSNFENLKSSNFFSSLFQSSEKTAHFQGFCPHRMTSNRAVKKRKVQKVTKMAEQEKEVIEIDDSSPSPDRKSTPLKPVFCLKNRHEIEKFEESEECFILDFDPYDDLDILKLSLSKGSEDDASDLLVVSAKGQVACRDFPHPRHSCAKYPFEKTRHDEHCELCYCYVCDSSAPCSKWTGTFGHCHAFNNEAWDEEKEVRRRKVVKKTI